MKYSVDYSLIAKESGFEAFSQKINKEDGFDSKETFNSYCKRIIELWRESFVESVGTTSTFRHFLQKIQLEPQNSISTPWGGVYLVEIKDRHIEKYLVVQSGKYLSFERHDEKEEELNVSEGAGFLLYREEGKNILTAMILLPGVKVEFKPGQEHCIIATEDLLIYERSEDHKGMDKDLIFIFQPE